MHERMQSHAFPSARMHTSMNAHVRTPYVMRNEYPSIDFVPQRHIDEVLQRSGKAKERLQRETKRGEATN